MTLKQAIKTAVKEVKSWPKWMQNLRYKEYRGK